MSIGSTIKHLRRERDITQEQLAEYLGITSRAVSQWECDRTAPDLSQLPALCHIFDVSADTLLGVDIERSGERIRDILRRAEAAESDGDFALCADILRQGLAQFPRSYAIMERLANALICIRSRHGEHSYEEPITLCRRVLAECTESAVRYAAMRTLGIAYGYAGDKQALRALAADMPPVHLSRENFMANRWEGDAEWEQLQGYLSFLIYHTVEMIEQAVGYRHDDGTFVHALDDRIALWQTQVALLEQLFPDGDYQFKAQLGEVACSRLCMAYLRRGDTEQAWRWLERGAAFARHMDTYDEDAPHTSPVLRGYADGGWIMEADGNRSQSLLAWLQADEEAAVLRADPRSAALIAQLQQIARKP